MKRLLALILVLLLLAGCTMPPEVTEPDPETQPPTEREEALGPALGRDDGQLYEATGGAVVTWPLEQNCDGVLILGDLVLLYFTGEQTQLNAYTGEKLNLKYSVSRYPQIPASGQGVTVSSAGMSYYDPESRTLVVMDRYLREIRKQVLPESVQGIPVLDRELKTAYYSTGKEIRALNLETGIAHMLRQQEESLELTGSCLNGQLLVAVSRDGDGNGTTTFIQTSDGLAVKTDDTLDVAEDAGDWYFVRRGNSGIPVYLTAAADAPVRVFSPSEPDAKVFALPGLPAVVTARQLDADAVLEYYDLTSGIRKAEVRLPGLTGIRDVTMDAAGQVWFLNDQNVLCRWSVESSAVNDTGMYISFFQENKDPAVEAMARAWEKGIALGEKYGISLRMMQDAILAPWENLTCESRTEVCEYMLTVVDETLGIFPEGFLAQLSEISDNGVLTISLVADAGPQGSQQTWLDGNAHVAVEPNEVMKRELLRSIYRVMDTYVLGKNSMLDDWDAARPAEDRAELFVQAMKQDNASAFYGSTAQKELRTLCRAIRDAFGLKKYDRMLPWEQYLDEPLYG